MKTYISLLRGINVSGRNSIKMDALKKMFEKLNCKDIKTHLQSGNVLFSTHDDDIEKWEKLISEEINKEFTWNVPTLVLTPKCLKEICDNNPLAKDKTKDTAFLHVTFLDQIPLDIDIESINEKRLPNEEIYFSSKAVYLYCPEGYGKTKLHNTFLERKLNVRATTRNWKTTTELLKLSQHSY